MSYKGGHLPVLNCRGSHYEVGHSIGTTFKSMIHDLLSTWRYYNEVVLKAGGTVEGKEMIKNCLNLCTQKYPNYVEEIKGMADGAEIDFKKLFMLNMDSILCTLKEVHKHEEVRNTGGTGCTTIICNKDEVVLGHTEDAMAEIQDHVYIISAEILCPDDNEKVIEKFTTLCYAGTLMGYTMGYNDHGMIYSVNTIFPTVYTKGTPRSFVARALLGATDLQEVTHILRDEGNGIADGFSLNVYFYPKNEDSNGMHSNVMLYNIEVAPPTSSSVQKESIVDIYAIKPDSAYTHCNRYSRVKMMEINPTALKYSKQRDAAISKHTEPSSVKGVKEILSDKSDYDYPIFNDGKLVDNENYAMSFIRTVALGIFDINQGTWSVYTSPPTTGSPIHTFRIPTSVNVEMN